MILFSFFCSTMLWALLDLLVQFLAFILEKRFDAILIVSYILAPSIGSFLSIGILLGLHLNNIISISELFRLRSYQNTTASVEIRGSSPRGATLLITSNDEL